jgi:hypothetical protein
VYLKWLIYLNVKVGHQRNVRHDKLCSNLCIAMGVPRKDVTVQLSTLFHRFEIFSVQCKTRIRVCSVRNIAKSDLAASACLLCPYVHMEQPGFHWTDFHKIYIYIIFRIYRVGHEKVARLPFCTCPCYCINFRIYAMLQTRATFSWPILRMGHENVARVCSIA